MKAEADAYGMTVRAGAVTPQTDDENQFRERLGLPAMSDDAKAAWSRDRGTRRPITLVPPAGESVPVPAGDDDAKTE